ncbi:molybdenum cofactor guanylyltransferase MobA [Aggregatibacter actinomycetemcomitans]|uniref:molybdenum cofactor guanylyltransferase MobA n=1 Tax=Aggregatibacter actinomycetemcomitans TaxID=714 RepID=UPI00024003E7|nr:molybdenum cofactor guanylyltransferase MobA [Aggregatibacter actinomycetemcomitans]EHK90883.1 molybdopterin-guanine dinucleotide biosynthesis protein MobA [Aggregatibacter actinomycetemcomitans RhAA1]KNE77925.1 molybdenum cofactor guanylyltransferase [Aggregatibacter actinomycetemcomitans RhAA1]MBN6079094.1 molybdenum cofactor guanylyltransferase MobA [Aggregatibacter actinomycetemcomitans]
MTISISAVILAGGRATRMGGADKGLQLLHGKPLFQWIYERLRSQVAQVSVNANRHRECYAATGLPVFADNLEGFQGPLSGILTALERSDTDFVLFVPCDSPFFPENLLEKLKSAVIFHGVSVAYVHDGEREHPTFCLMARSLKDKLAAYLASGERRMLHFMRQNGAVSVDFSENQQAFANINTFDELQQLNGQA